MKLMKLLKELKLNESASDDLFDDVLELIRTRTRKMSDDETYKFHERLKAWMNKLI